MDDLHLNKEGKFMDEIVRVEKLFVALIFVDANVVAASIHRLL